MKLCSIYRPRKNLQSTYTIPAKDEADYVILRNKLKHYGITQGEYIISCFRELDKHVSSDLRLKAVAWKKRS
jgi:hypothetical protein